MCIFIKKIIFLNTDNYYFRLQGIAHPALDVCEESVFHHEIEPRDDFDEGLSESVNVKKLNIKKA